MLYLMVGGPWHGTWKQLDPDMFSTWMQLVWIPDPLKAPVFEQATEFGVPVSTVTRLENVSSQYYIYRFERRSLDGQDMSYAYIDAVVWVGITGGRGEVMMDALSSAVDPWYMKQWRMPL